MLNVSRIKIRKIGYRILALVSACVAIVVVTFGQIYAQRLEQAMRAMGERDMQRLMETVIGSVESIMLPGQASLVQSFAERLKTVPDVVDFRIVRSDGNEAFHDNRTLDGVNVRLGNRIFALRERETVVPVLPAADPNLSAAMQPGQHNLVSYQEPGSGEPRRLTFIYAIPNRGSCHGCHGAERPFVGAVKLTASMATVDTMMAAARRDVWLATGAALLLALLLVGAMIRRSVARPIEAVTAAMQRAAEGNLEQVVPVPGDDEIGQMARSFNIMMARLNELYQGLRLEQDKLNTVIQSTGEGVVVTDATGRIVLVNDAAVHLLGKRRQRIEADGFKKLLDNPEIVDTLLQRQTSAVPSPFKVSYKGRVLRVIAATIHGKQGTTIGSAALLRDITPVHEPEAFSPTSPPAATQTPPPVATQTPPPDRA